MDSVFFHNPDCSKCRDALQLLRENGVEPRIVAYLEQPPSRDELRTAIRLLGINARGLLRRSEPEYTTLELANPALDEEAVIDAMVAYPRLIERPVFIHRGRAIIGRPPERVLELLDEAPAG